MFSKLIVSAVLLATAMAAPSATPSSHAERQLNADHANIDPFAQNFRGDAELNFNPFETRKLAKHCPKGQHFVNSAGTGISGCFPCQKGCSECSGYYGTCSACVAGYHMFRKGPSDDPHGPGAWCVKGKAERKLDRKLRGYKCWPSGTSVSLRYQCKGHYDPSTGTCPCCSGKILKNGGNSICV